MHRNPLTFYQRWLQTILLRLRPASLASILKRLLGINRIIVDTPHGRYWVDPVSNVGSRITIEGVYEPTMQKVLEKFLFSGATFVDLGSNEGYFTVIGALLCGSSGRVVAIEPQERLLPVIEKNLLLNEVTWASVLNVAVTDIAGESSIHLAPDINTGMSGLHRSTKYHLPTQQVSSCTLAQILDDEQLAHVDLMKVDIEGFEYEALLGSPEVFKKHRVKALALELHPWILVERKKEVSDITNMLEECGYKKTEIVNNDVWLAPN
jgi:FkbM family methyltransferase